MTSILDRHRERFQATPGDTQAFEALEEHLFLAGDWKGVVALYEHRLGAPALVANPKERAQVGFRLAQVVEERLLDSPRAASILGEVLRNDPQHRPALTLLRRSHLARGHWEVALQIAEVESELPMRSSELVALLCEMGSIWRDRLADAPQALAQFDRALAEQPEATGALVGAAKSLETCGRFREAAGTWERLVATQKGSDRAASLVALAKLCEGPLEQAERAWDLYRRALGDDSNNTAALDAVALQAQARGQWPLLADLLERRFEGEADASARAELATRLARVFAEQLANPKATQLWCERAANLGCDDAVIHETLADIARKRADDAALRLHLASARRLRGDSAPLSLLLELASLYSDDGDDERALVELQCAAQRAPGDGLALEALSDTLARLGRDEDLVDILEQRAANSADDAPAAAAALAELGALQAERLGDAEAALDAYERAFRTDPQSPHVATALERLYRKTDAWQSLAALLETVARTAPFETRPATLCALAELRRERFDDFEAAARALHEALQIDPHHLGAHRGLQQLAHQTGDEDAVLRAYEAEASITGEGPRLTFLVTEIVGLLRGRGELLEVLRWRERQVAACPDDPAALGACADVLAELGRWDELAAALAQLDPLLPPEARGENRRRLGAALVSSQQIEAAIAAFRSAADADPRDAAALAEWAGLLEASNRPAELVPVRRRLAELLPPKERAQCLDSLVELLAERLGDVAGAIDVSQCLVREPEAPPGAIDRFEQLLERSARFDDLANHLCARLAALGARHVSANATQLRLGGVLLDLLCRFEEAATAFRGVLRRDRESVAARAGLERALRAAGNAPALAEFFADQVRTSPDAGVRERSAFELAELLAGELADPEAAGALLQRLARAATDPTLRQRASRRREDLLERSGAWTDLRSHLTDCLEEHGRHAEIHDRLGRLCRDRLGDAVAARHHLRAAAGLSPTSAKLWHEVAELCEAAGLLGEVVDALEAELAATPDGDRERELALRSRIAAHCLTLHASARAEPHCERIFELDPSNSIAAQFLIGCRQRAGDPGAELRLLEALLSSSDAAPSDAATSRPEQRGTLRVRIAELRARAFHDIDGAIAVLEPALAEIGPCSAVAEPLAELYERAGFRDDLIALLGDAANACEDPGDRATWTARLGNCLCEAGREREAAAAYRGAQSDRPDDRDVQARLRELYRRLHEDEPLARLLEVDLARCAGHDEVPLRLELAQLLAGAMQRPHEALVHLRRVLQIEPGHADALERAIELARRSGQTATLLDLFEGSVAVKWPAPERARLLSARARILSDEPGRSDAAIDAYREALALDRTRSADRSALRELLAARGDWKAALDCLYLETQATSGVERAELLERAAQMAWQNISPDAALPWLERLGREHPTDATVAARISDVHRRADRPTALLAALEKEAALAADPAPLHRERARILASRLNSPARAAAALEAAATATPDVETLVQLESLYRRCGRDRERARVLEALIEVGGADSRIAYLCDAAAIYADRLADPERAAEHLSRAVELTRGSGIHTELLRALSDVLRAAHRPDAWARRAEEELRALDSESPVLSDRRRELRRQLAAAYEHELGRPAAALLHLRALLGLKWTTTHGAGPEELDAIENAVLRLLRAGSSWIELEQRLAAHVTRRSDHIDCWRELARLREERLHAPAAAADAYAAALQLRPDDLICIRGLRRCAERTGDWEAVARSLELELDGAAALAPQQRAALLRRLGDLCWRQLASTTRASRCYASALEADPRDLESLRALQQLLSAMEDWRGALDLYESELEMLDEREPERRREAALCAGEIARDRTGDPVRALRAYRIAAGIGDLPSDRLAELAELERATGDSEAFAASFAAWCDADGSKATSADHLRLAETLGTLGRPTEARRRCDRALALDPENLAAWDTAARLGEGSEDPAGAARALERAAELAPDSEAAARLAHAAELTEALDAEDALRRYRAAARRDPGNARIVAAITRVCSRLGDFSETVEMASRALELAGNGAALEPARLLETALLGARAARERGDDETAVRCYARALEIEPEHADALAEYGETLAGLGRSSESRAALEKRLALAVADDRRALHLAMLAAALEADGEPAAACARFEEAIAAEPTLDRAHADLIRLHERSDRVALGIACLERWADGARTPRDRAERLLHAALWELRHSSRAAAAESHLRDALEADSGLGGAWEALADLLWEQDRADEAFDVASLAAGCVSDKRVLGRMALYRGRVLELRGDGRAAADEFAVAARAEPRCVDAALSRARLLRGLGEWRQAASALREFAGHHPGDDAKGLADVLQQLGRLLAGPLEDVDGAILAYRRALEVDPERIDSRAALAEFLSHRPENREEALAHHRTLLEADPTHAPSLRVLLRIARERNEPAAIAMGRRILCALGIGSPDDREADAEAARLAFRVARKLEDPLWEKLRSATAEAAREIATALESSNRITSPASAEPAAVFRAATMHAEGELTAPALLPLDDAKLADVLKLTAALALDPEQLQGNGQLVNAMSVAIRRRTLRRLRRIFEGVSLAEIAAIDFSAWRSEIRALAALVALDAVGGDLRLALIALIEDESDHGGLDLPDGADLTPYVAAYPVVRSLLRRVVIGWLQGF